MPVDVRPLWCGLTLATWRAALREVRYTYYRVLPSPRGQATDPYQRCELRHVALLCAACLLLPVTWHKQHAGRLAPGWRAIQEHRLLPVPPARSGLVATYRPARVKRAKAAKAKAAGAAGAAGRG